MTIAIHAVAVPLFLSLSFSQAYGQGLLESQLPFGNRAVLGFADEYALRVKALHPYQQHLESASRLRQAKEDFVFAYYELSFSYLRAMGDIALQGPEVASRCSARLQHLLRGYPAEPDVLYLEASLQLDSLMFAESLPDQEFKQVMATLRDIKADGPASAWIHALKARIFSAPNADKFLEEFCQQFKDNADESPYARRIRIAFKADDNHLTEIARRCKQLGLSVVQKEE